MGIKSYKISLNVSQKLNYDFKLQLLTLSWLFFRIEVPTMSKKVKLPVGYSQEMECRVLELPFSQRRISMFILLPDDPINGLAKLEANISTIHVKKIFSTLKVASYLNSTMLINASFSLTTLTCLINGVLFYHIMPFFALVYLLPT